MTNCPNCNNSITYWQLMKHSCWTPIICKKCNAKLAFDKIDWFKKASYVMILNIISLIIVLTRCTQIWILIIVLALLIAGLFTFTIKIRNIKLQVKEN